MMMVAKLVVAAAALAGASVAAASPGTPELPGETPVKMVPGKATRLAIGTKHSVSYFEPVDQSCGVTVVLAEAGEEVSMNDADRTRIVVPVAPGKALRIDGTQEKSAEFFCGPGGQQMTVRVFQRQHYKSAKS